MKTLELKDIAGYLPYGLKYLYEGKTIGEVRMQDYVTTIDSMLRLNFIIQPILRPMSDLTKEITHRGEKLVPIVEIGKMLGYSNLEKCETDSKIEYGFETRYADDTQGFTFGWCQELRSFGVWYDCQDDETPSVERLLMNTVAFDKLSEWMFDYRGLIPASLAIDANTLPENPYEK